MRTRWLVATLISVSAPVAAEEVKRVTAPEELVKSPKSVARRLQTGANTRDSSLETFTLQRLGERALLTVETMRADTNDGKIGKWEKQSFIQYLGTATTDGDVTTIKFSNRPLTLDWTCKKVKLDVAAATAVLGHDPKFKGKDCGDPGRWQPAASKKVEGFQCTEVPPADADPTAEPDPKTHLAFAPSPGIEWLYIDDECVLKGGGWRRIDKKATVGEVRAKGVLRP